MVSPIEAGSERDYFTRQSYGSQQHQMPSSNSPGSHHYPPPGQQPHMGYQPQATSFPYGGPPGSQSHAGSPTPQYAHQAGLRRNPRELHSDLRDARDLRDPRGELRMDARAELRSDSRVELRGEPRDSREPGPPTRETGWPTPQSQQQQAAQQAGWTPQKVSQPPPPTQSAWGAQHATAPSKPQQQIRTPQPSWDSAPPQPPHMGLRESLSAVREGMRDERAMNERVMSERALRDERYAAAMQHERVGHDPRLMGSHPQHPQHQHHPSMSGRIYAPSPGPREAQQAPPQQQPGYTRYATPGPQPAVQQRRVVEIPHLDQTRIDRGDPGPGRSYTPVSAYDPRGHTSPHPGVPGVPYGQDPHQQLRELRGNPVPLELRGDHPQVREMREMREMRGEPPMRDLRGEPHPHMRTRSDLGGGGDPREMMQDFRGGIERRDMRGIDMRPIDPRVDPRAEFRDPRVDPRGDLRPDPRGDARGGDPVSQLQRQLRPQDNYDRMQDRRY